MPTLPTAPIIPLLAHHPWVLLALPPLLLAALLAYRIVLKPYVSKYRHLPGPRPIGLRAAIWGNLPEIRVAEPADQHLKWMDQYGPVLVYKGMLYSDRLWITDPKALNYVLMSKSYEYPKPEGTRSFLARLLGEGILVAEGHAHRRQRKVLNPAFSQSSVRDLTPTFFRHANRLSRHLGAIVDGVVHDPSPAADGANAVVVPAQAGTVVTDAMFWLSRTTLDIIGDAGFSYNFNSLIGGEEGDEVADAFNSMMKAGFDMSLLNLLVIAMQKFRAFRWLRKLPTKRNLTIKSCLATMQRVSRQILEEKKRLIAAEVGLSLPASPPDPGHITKRSGAALPPKLSANADVGGGEKLSKSAFDEDVTTAGGHKDVLHLVIRANMADDLKDNERLRDDEVLGQLTTMILAGHETTATSLTWTLWTLSNHPDVQSKLRAEVQAALPNPDSEINYSELNELPFLEKVTKEMMRFTPAVPSTVRTAAHDDIIPLGNPVLSRDGKRTITELPVKKGDEVLIPITAVNKSKFIFGPDADKFRPDRWDELPQAVIDAHMPGNVMTFMNGPRSCIGSKFALTEFKVILSTLIRSFKFEPVPGLEIETKQGIVLRPRVISQKEKGSQMPLIVSRA